MENIWCKKKKRSQIVHGGKRNIIDLKYVVYGGKII